MPGPHPAGPTQGSPAARRPFAMALVVTPPPSMFVAPSVMASAWPLACDPPNATLGSPVPLALTMLWGPQCLWSWAEASQGSRSFSAFLSAWRVIASHPHPHQSRNDPFALSRLCAPLPGFASSGPGLWSLGSSGWGREEVSRDIQPVLIDPVLDRKSVV